jgi:hypothetical protein
VTQIGAKEVGTGQVGIGEIRSVQICIRQVLATEVPARKVIFSKLNSSQILGLIAVCCIKLFFGETLRRAKVGAGYNGFGKISPSQIGSTKRGAPEIGS